MDKEELKTKIDFNRLIEVEKELLPATSFIKDKEEILLPAVIDKIDYLVDELGNKIIPLSPLECKFIEEIKLLKERLTKLEEVKE